MPPMSPVVAGLNRRDPIEKAEGGFSVLKRHLIFAAGPMHPAIAAACAALISFSACQKESGPTPAPTAAAPEAQPNPGAGKPTSEPAQPFALTGSPRDTVPEGSDYEFRPSVSGVPRHEEFRFSIRNRPHWATFDTKRGFLGGRPGKGDAGNYSGIEIIAATDSGLTSSLPPFSIVVTATNTPPAISGTPAPEAAAGQAYTFTPEADDPDTANGQQLRFAIANKPSWLTFDAITGRLSGTPTAEQAGLYEKIMIAVTDSVSPPATLPPFSIRVVESIAPAETEPPADLGAWTAMLSSADLSERQKAARALAAMGPKAAPAVPQLIQGLDDPSAAQQAACARALGRTGEKGREAVSLLSQKSRPPAADDLRLAAIEALGSIGGPHSLPALEQALADGDVRIRRAAARSLAVMGPQAKASVPALSESLKQGNEDAAQALGKIGDPLAVPALAAALADWRTAYGAAWALKEIGPGAVAAAPQLEQASVSGSTAAIRRMAEEALASVKRSQP